MSYESIGNEMFGNVQPFINNLDSTANLANSALDVVTNVISAVKKGIDFISDILVKFYNALPGWLRPGDDSTEVPTLECYQSSDGSWHCIDSDGNPFYGNGEEVTEPPCTGLECTI